MMKANCFLWFLQIGTEKELFARSIDAKQVPGYVCESAQRNTSGPAAENEVTT